MTPLLLIILITLITILIVIFARLIQSGRMKVALRPLPGYEALEGQVGLAIESGSRIHTTLGRAGLAGSANPTSIAALTVLDRLAAEGCANDTPPLTTLGEGTLLPIAQDSLRAGYRRADLKPKLPSGAVQFIAHDTEPYAYAAGVGAVIQQHKISSNVMVGRFGEEIGIMAGIANRNRIDQIIGADDPVALSLAAAATNNLLIGEELLVAGAYLEGQPSQLAGVRVQDLLRIIIALTILALAVYQLVVG